MSNHLTAFRDGFAEGFTAVTRCDDPNEPTGISLGILRLRAGASQVQEIARETAWLLLNGSALFSHKSAEWLGSRSSIFEQPPTLLHASARELIALTTFSDCEFAVYETANQEIFEPRFYSPSDVHSEYRGKGLVGDACYRIVRPIVDRRTSHPAAELAVGEIVTLPGRWSSYPPHHHVQPEIYHYRFARPEGYGHAELGEQVYKVRQYDSLRILSGNDHAQCAAPGYAMYYCWALRHLPGNPYLAPEVTEEHRWTLDPKAQIWQPPTQAVPL